MKKIVLSCLIILTYAISAYSQEISENAIGLRIGDSDGLGVEVSYQRFLWDNNRIEFDLGWRNSKDVDAFKLTTLYQWVFPIEGNFNWYVGAGGGIGSFNAPHDSGVFLFLAGDGGVEYNFPEIPLLLSLDIRPELNFNDHYSDRLDLDIAIGVRYQF
jgi:hypothetical protein